MLIFDQLRKDDPQLRALTALVLAGVLTLLAGLWYVQVISSKRFVDNQRAQAYRTVRIPAARGKILDRNGHPFADNYPNYRINLYLEELPRLFKDEWRRTKPARALLREERLALESMARFTVVSNLSTQLGQVVGQPIAVSLAEFSEHYNSQPALPLTLANQLNAVQIARFQEQPVIPPGLDLDVQPMRSYLYGTTAAHILGYLRRDNQSREGEEADYDFRLPDYRGKVGIEHAFDSTLCGRAGMKSVLVNNLGYRQSESTWVESEPGTNVVLTIDLAIQRAAERGLQAALNETRGAVVVMDCRDGDILAMASAPSFDPNRFIPRISREDWEALSDPKLRPQINRAIQEHYAPGSIFKIITAMACLESGLDPDRSQYNPGFIHVGRRRPIHDLAPPGDYDFKKAFIFSSNTYFISNGLNAGVDRILEISRRLHLGELAGIPLPGQEKPGILPKPGEAPIAWHDGDTANLCIGQGYLSVTPLQMTVMTAAIANGGAVLWPRLIDRLVPQDPLHGSQPLVFKKAQVRDRLNVSKRTLELIQEAMRADVEERGTGKAAHIPGYTVSGKTGTAQVTDPSGKVVDHTVWFASFAPYEDPKYAVVVMVESGASGGGTCAPIARQVFEALRQRDAATAARPAGLAKPAPTFTSTPTPAEG
ncbi:MAG: penicillin-binding protein 2 [Verrucomicrobia bacterium]|nr:penicillin-binding protein 2 [Verrucomicrobiota bacterium]MBI3868176.1 penicillin-binding protein 2 [Verrucomicrobiota bacterium]